MLPYPAILGISLLAILGFTVIVYAVTGSLMAVLVIFALAGIMFYLLTLYGYIKVDSSTQGLDIKFFETAPSPSYAKPISPEPRTAVPVVEKEVFYVSGNDYTYDDAPAVCAAYESELASYDQIMGAYSDGAEWCGYGWSQGGMALYPTQQATWEALQQEADNRKRTACGRPGVNGGYFDPNTKFGVNCYGVKPGNKGDQKLPLPLPGTDPSAFNQAVDKFKSMLNKMSVSPFNRDAWSEYNGMPSLPKKMHK